MKFSFLALALVLSAPLAHADYSSDVAGKSVRCTAPQTIVVIDRARSLITVIDAIDAGHPAEFKVVRHGGDGDTDSEYIGRDGDEVVTLSFSDRGDSLDYKSGASLKLRCPN